LRVAMRVVFAKIVFRETAEKLFVNKMHFYSEHPPTSNIMIV